MLQLKIERLLFNELKKLYPSMVRIPCLAFGIRYVYYSDSSLSCCIGEGLYLDASVSRSEIKDIQNSVPCYYQTDCLIIWKPFES